jgi:hypothetical protein
MCAWYDLVVTHTAMELFVGIRTTLFSMLHCSNAVAVIPAATGTLR